MLDGGLFCVARCLLVEFLLPASSSVVRLARFVFFLRTVTFFSVLSPVAKEFCALVSDTAGGSNGS